jgi:putative glutamine amidotransferase
MPRRVVGLVTDRRAIDGMPVHLAHDEYVTAIRDGAGALPLLIPSTDTALSIDAILSAVDGLLFTGNASNVAPGHYGATARDGTVLDELATPPLCRCCAPPSQRASPCWPSAAVSRN